MENYEVYDKTTNKELTEQAKNAAKMYYNTFEELEIVRVSPTRQIVRKVVRSDYKKKKGSR